MKGVFKWLQCHSTFLKNKGNVEAMLNESLNHLNLIQQYAFNKLSTFFYTFSNVERPVKMPQRKMVQQNVECMLKQMLNR